jgi:hypothetical protein
MTENEIKQQLSGLGLGISKADVFNDSMSVIINSVNRQAVEMAREILLSRSLSKSATLAQTIVAMPVQVSGNVYSFKVIASKEADFVDKGVSGIEKKIESPYSFNTPRASIGMVEAIRSWVQAAGLFADNYNSLSWAIATNVKKKGIDAKNWTEAFGDDYIDEMKRVVSIALKKLVEVSFKKMADGNNNT